MRGIESRLGRLEQRLAGRARERSCNVCGGEGKAYYVVDGEQQPGHVPVSERGCPGCGKVMTIRIVDADPGSPQWPSERP